MPYERSIHFECDKCGAGLYVDVTKIPTDIKCDSCNRVVKVPGSVIACANVFRTISEQSANSLS